MIQVSRKEFDELRKANLIRFGNDKNYQISNKKKCGSRKKYYVVEEKQVLNFLKRKYEV